VVAAIKSKISNWVEKSLHNKLMKAMIRSFDVPIDLSSLSKQALENK
jgi:hypothetical protein